MQYPKSADSASKPSSAKGRKDGRHKKRRKGSDPREIGRRGIRIADNEGQIKRHYKRLREVASQSVSGKRYEVVLAENGFHCECKYHEEGGGRRCKHMAAVETTLMREAQAVTLEKQLVIEPAKPACPECASEAYHKDGVRPCRRKDPTRRFKCKNCRYRFSDNRGFEGRHFASMIITLALTIFAFGISPDGISQILRQAGTAVHPVTVQRWADRYVDLVEAYVNTLAPPRLGLKWSSDEKSKDMRGQERWVFTVMDGVTRFTLCHDVSPLKLGYNAVPLLETAKKRAGFVPPDLRYRRTAIVRGGVSKGVPDAQARSGSHQRDPPKGPAPQQQRPRKTEWRAGRPLQGQQGPQEGECVAHPHGCASPQLHTVTPGTGRKDPCRGGRDNHTRPEQVAHADPECRAGRRIGARRRAALRSGCRMPVLCFN